MYVKIRKDGAVGIGKGTEGRAEITLGYGEAHMIAAALEKLAQTARNYKQTYKKTTDVGGGNRIDFERAEDGTITVSGDGQTYFLTESEVRELADMLNNLPPVEVTPPSKYVQKIAPEAGVCLVVKNGGKSLSLTLPEAALIRTSIQNSVDSRFFLEPIVIGKKKLNVTRSSELKWMLSYDGNDVKFTAYEIEALMVGLHNVLLDVLMDMVKSLGSDDIADIRVKSQIQRIEQDSAGILGEHKKAKGRVRNIVKRSRKILGTVEDGESRLEEFVKLCRHIQAKFEPQFVKPLFDLIGRTFVTES